MKIRTNFVCYFTLALLGIYLSTYQSLIDTIGDSLAIDATMAGIIISLHFIGSMIAPTVFGEISDRIGKKVIIELSLVLCIVGLLLVYSFHKLIPVAIGIFIIGCGFGTAEGTLTGVLADMNKTQANKVINISQMTFGIGAAIGPIVAFLVIDLFGSWKANYLLMSLLITIILVFVHKSSFAIDSEGSKTSDTKHEEQNGLISVGLLKQRSFVLLCISIFIYVGIEEGTAFWISTYFNNTYNVKDLGIYALSGFWGSMIVGRYIASKFESKFKVILFLSLSVSFVFLILILIRVNAIFCFIGFIGVGFGFSAIWPALMALTVKLFPKYTGTVTGIMMTFSAAGGIVLPLFIGAASGMFGINRAMWIVPIMVIIIYAVQMILLKDLKNKSFSVE